MSTRNRTAASSIANGIPSSRWQSWMTRLFIVGGDLEAGNDRSPPGGEQVDGRELRRRAGSETNIDVGHRERWNRVHMLTGDHQRLSAVARIRSFGAARSSRSTRSAAASSMLLAVVEDYQGVPGAQVVGEDQRGRG